MMAALLAAATMPEYMRHDRVRDVQEPNAAYADTAMVRVMHMLTEMVDMAKRNTPHTSSADQNPLSN